MFTQKYWTEQANIYCIMHQSLPKILNGTGQHEVHRTSKVYFKILNRTG